MALSGRQALTAQREGKAAGFLLGAEYQPAYSDSEMLAVGKTPEEFSTKTRGGEPVGDEWIFVCCTFPNNQGF